MSDSAPSCIRAPPRGAHHNGRPTALESAFIQTREGLANDRAHGSAHVGKVQNTQLHFNALKRAADGQKGIVAAGLGVCFFDALYVGLAVSEAEGIYRANLRVVPLGLALGV